jgi:sulfate adenylyltransferase subunit 2
MDPALAFFGLMVGFLVGLTGIGGGSLMTPLLILVFGVKPVTAVGTDLAYAAVTKTVGGYKHWRQRTVDMRLSSWMAVGSVPSAVCGVYVLDLLEAAYGDSFDTLLLTILGGALLFTGAATLGRAWFMNGAVARERTRFDIRRRHKVAAVSIGAFVGFVLGVTSAGSGALIAVALILVFRLVPTRVVGTDVFHAAILLWAAAAAHVVSGNVDYALASNLLIGSIPGVWIGSHWAVRLPAQTLRTVLGVVLTGGGLGLLAKGGADVPDPVLAVVPPLVVGLIARPVWRAHRERRTARKAGATAAVSRPVSGSYAEPDYLGELEAESIHIMREVAAEFERPVLLFSGGKDSIVLLRLAQKAFAPGGFPFTVMHVDTGHNFPEVLEFRDKLIRELDARLVVASVQDAIDAGRVIEDTGPRASRNRLQTVVLLDAIAEHGFDACLGGARRDEERARAKERIFSFRDDFGQWDPKNQRPELWNLYNGRIRKGEHVRVFPLSDWTEFDVWQYIARERLEVPSIYFAHEREVFERDGMLYAESAHVARMPGEEVFATSVRYRTVGDMSCTGAIESHASTLDEVVAEIAATRITERGQTRADDRASEAAMEDRKREGYF